MDVSGILKPSKGKSYFFISALFWIIAEYVTVWHSKIWEWLAYTPSIFVYYLGWPLLFHYFIFRRGWDETRTLALMLAVSLVLEASWGNEFIVNPALLPLGIPLLVSIYGFITFVPLWIVEGKIDGRRIQTAYCLLWAAAALLSILGGSAK